MTDRRPFRFAVQAVKATSASEWRALATRAEDLGYRTLFVADHYLGPGPALELARQPVQHLAPIAAMAAAASVTTDLRVGCRVFCVDYHVPAVLVKEALTIDLLSDGRLELGLGAGWSGHEYEAMGLTFGPPAERVAKLRAVVGLVKAHAAGDVLDVEGRHVTARGYTGLPAPAQRPHPPIMIGGAGKVVLSFAGREADIVSINNVPYDAVNADGLTPQEEAIRRLGYVRDAAGDRFTDLDIEGSPFFTRITDDVAAAEDRIAGVVGTTADGLRNHPQILLGTVDELVDLLEERRERYGVNYVTVQQGVLDHFAPVVARLAGT